MKKGLIAFVIALLLSTVFMLGCGEDILDPHTVSFDKQGGVGEAQSITVELGSEYGELPVVTKTGYNFEGWYTQIGGVGEKIESTTIAIITSDQTLYAYFTAQRFTLDFDKQGGEGEAETCQVTYDSAYGNLPTLSKEGNVFVGWFTEAGAQAKKSKAQR